MLRILPDHVGGDLGGSAAAVGLAVGAPALTAVVAPPWAGAGPTASVPASAGRRRAVMAAGVVPALGGLAALDVSAGLLVGVGEGAMMAASVLWLLRLAGRRAAAARSATSACAGLAAGPLAEALGTDPAHVFAAVIALPLIGAAAIIALAGDEPTEGSDPWLPKSPHRRGFR